MTKSDSEPLYLVSTRPALTWGSLLRIPLALVAMIVVTGGLFFVLSRAGIGDLPLQLDGYIPFFAGLAAAVGVLRLLGRLMPHASTHFVTVERGVATIDRGRGSPVELPLDSVDVLRGKERPQIELGGEDDEHDEPIVVPREIRGAGEAFVLAGKYQRVDAETFETMKSAGRTGATTGLDYVQFLARGRELIPAQVRVRIEGEHHSSATWHRI